MKTSLQNDHEILKGLQKRDDAAYEILYDFYFPKVKKFVVNNNGTPDDAQDIFQETLLVLLKNVPLADFELRSSLGTYIFSIASNLWLKRLRDSKKMVVKSEAEVEEIAAEIEEDFDFKKPPEAEEKAHSLLQKITEMCQRLIRSIFFLKKDIMTIQSEMGYASRHSAQNQKYKCIQQLKKAHKQMEANDENA